jgi:GNAT superfamily N-acetyltransferase
LPGVELIEATLADADAVAAIFGAARGKAMPWLPVLHSEAEDRAYFKGVIEGSDVLLARRGPEPIAFIAIGKELVEHLYVRPEDQRGGVGSALLEAAMSRRPGGLSLWTFQRNEGARAFYLGHGFAEVRLTDGSGNEEREPDVLLAWAP